jgi:hypothetical protein
MWADGQTAVPSKHSRHIVGNVPDNHDIILPVLCLYSLLYFEVPCEHVLSMVIELNENHFTLTLTLLVYSLLYHKCQTGLHSF